MESSEHDISVASAHLWVVVVGASAGGLDALQRFFSKLRKPSNAAFVVVQHLAPDHRSLMADLLGPHCALDVKEGVDGQLLLPDQVYLMPSGVMLSIDDGHLRFEPRPFKGLSLPINRVLESLAAHNAGQTVAVVLSGSGSDGSAGASELRRRGGFVLVQDPASAQFDSMPRSVIQSTQVDACQPPEGLAETVLAITQGRADRLAEEGLVHAPSARSALHRVFTAMLDRHGIDFSQYKLPTIMRRIERRMQAGGCTSLASYAELVESSSDECELLRRELLIPVTGFFRDPEAFEALLGELEHMIRQLPEQRGLRLWSAGCATGEEAYSLAILACEACERAGKWPAIKVFGTDVDPVVLETAASGVYPAELSHSLTPERLARHFNVTEQHLSVKPELRRLVLFTRHNLLEDPPFTRMDVVACRNTLIYLQASAQERVLLRLQYGLQQDGLLFLGSSESLGPLQPDFLSVHQSARIHRLIKRTLPPLGRLSPPGKMTTADLLHVVAHKTVPDQGRWLVDAAQQRLLQDQLPLSLLLSSQRVLMHAWGPADQFLRLQGGSPRLDAIGLLPDRVAAVASHAFHQVMKGKAHAPQQFKAEVNGQMLNLRLDAQLIQHAASGTQAVLIMIHQLAALDARSASDAALMSDAELDRLGDLEQELAETRLSLQTTIEDLEATNEELQATNEELMSTNEELQSTNEELQSVNEELYTVNAEFNLKLEALSSLNADLEGMALSTGTATIFVDHDLTLLRFTPEAAVLFRLRASDVGRRITDFHDPMDYPDFLLDVSRVLSGHPAVEREVAVKPEGLYRVRIVGCGDNLRGKHRAVISLIDISRTREAQQLQSVLNALAAHVAVLDVNGTIVQVNAAWQEFAALNGGTRDVGVGTNYLAVLARSTSPGALDVLRGLQQVLGGQQTSYEVTYPCHSPDENRWFTMSATACKGMGGAVVTHYNITPWHQHIEAHVEAPHAANT